MREGTYGAALRVVRKRLGLSQEGLAVAAGMDRSHVRKIETGNIKSPDQATRDRLAAALGITDDDVLAELNLFRESRPEYQFGMDSDEHDFKQAMLMLPHEDRTLIMDFIEMVVRRHEARYE